MIDSNYNELFNLINDIFEEIRESSEPDYYFLFDDSILIDVFYERNF
jgi:hypothetical protein